VEVVAELDCEAPVEKDPVGEAEYDLEPVTVADEDALAPKDSEAVGDGESATDVVRLMVGVTDVVDVVDGVAPDESDGVGVGVEDLLGVLLGVVLIVELALAAATALVEGVADTCSSRGPSPAAAAVASVACCSRGPSSAAAAAAAVTAATASKRHPTRKGRRAIFCRHWWRSDHGWHHLEVVR
jgi:hypothetical protein